MQVVGQSFPKSHNFDILKDGSAFQAITEKSYQKIGSDQESEIRWSIPVSVNGSGSQDTAVTLTAKNGGEFQIGRLNDDLVVQSLKTKSIYSLGSFSDYNASTIQAAVDAIAVNE